MVRYLKSSSVLQHVFLSFIAGITLTFFYTNDSISIPFHLLPIDSVDYFLGLAL